MSSTMAREIEGIPTVSSATERGVRFPSPVTGQKVYNLEAGLERYNGTSWVPIAGTRSVTALGDGTTDDTASIQAVLSAANDGDTVLFPRPSVAYRVGKIEINRSLRLVGAGALMRGSGAAIFCVTAAIDWLQVEGFEVEFESTTGDTGKEFLVNASTAASATIADYGESLTVFAEYATISNINRLIVRDCRLGHAKVTVVASGDDTHATVVDNHWEHADGVHAAPTYLELYGIKHPIVRDNTWLVYPPAGDNEDIVKIWGPGAEDLQFIGNRVHNLHADTTCAQLDIYYGGARANIAGNTFINVNVQGKVWGPPPNLGYDYKALSVCENTFVRESGFTIAASWEGTIYNVALFVMATRFNVQGNRFVDLNAAGDPLTAIYLGRSTGAPPPDFDSLATIHCRAFTIVGNTASFTHGNNEGIFARWRNNDATDLAANGTLIGNVMHGGRGFFEANEQLASDLLLIGNVWLTTYGGALYQLGLVAPCVLVGNDFPSGLTIPANLGTVIDGRLARMLLDGGDADVPAGGVGISESGGSLRLSARQNVQVLLDNDASGTNAFSVYNDVTSPVTPIHELHGDGYYEAAEITDPSAPGANRGRLYFRDNGAAKTQLVVRFPTGAVQVIATEP